MLQLVLLGTALAASLTSGPQRGGLGSAGVAGMLDEMSSSSRVAVVASLGTVPRIKRGSMVDAAFSTSVGSDEENEAFVAGGTVELGGRRVLVLECGPADAFGQTSTFVGACADVCVVSAWRSDVGKGVAANANLLRGLREACKSRGAKTALVVAVHGDGPDAEAGVLADLKGLTDAFSSVDVVDSSDTAKLKSVVGARCGEAEAASSGSVAQAVSNAWDASRATVPADDVAAFVCDAAGMRCRERAEAAFARWRRDVDDGRLAPRGWSAECADLYRDVLEDYDAATIAYWRHACRAATRSTLESRISDEARVCHLAQLDAASQRRLRRLRARLEKTAAAHPRGELDQSPADRLVADAEFDFDLDATRCEVPSLGLSADSARASFRDAARGLAADFSESPAGQLLATRAEEKTATAATRAKVQPRSKPKVRKPPAISYALQLVGMLRPRGYGNVQAFCSYALGPHSLLFGYADDRDTSGDMTASDDVPLLRLQPKITLDVDL